VGGGGEERGRLRGGEDRPKGRERGEVGGRSQEVMWEIREAALGLGAG